MEDQLINYATAVLAKEKGYTQGRELYYVPDNKEATFSWWSDDPVNRKINEFKIHAPTQSLLQKWLRDNHNIEVMVKSWTEGGLLVYLHSAHNISASSSYINKDNNKTYEEALEIGLQKGLNLIK